MHILGKILIGLIVPLALTASVLTSKLIVYRNSWTQKIDEEKKKNLDNDDLIPKRQRELDELRTNLSNVMLGWDRFWVVPTTENNGELTGEIGFSDGLGSPAPADPSNHPLPIVYVFRPVGNNQWNYVGAFQVKDDLTEDQTTLVPTWRIREGEIESWGESSSNMWRWRTQIPSSTIKRFSDLYSEFTIEDDRLLEQEGHLVSLTDPQKGMLFSAQEDLRFRREELLGGGQGNNAQKNMGLVNAMVLAEEMRNRELAGVDRLRRELRQANISLKRLIDGNRENAKKLPPPTVDVTSAAVKTEN